MDRNVHARGVDGRVIVRYDRAGKWWLERPNGTRAPLQIPSAVAEAAEILHEGGTVFWDQPGGTRFESALRKRLDFDSDRRERLGW